MVGGAGGQEGEAGTGQSAFQQAADGQAAFCQFDASVNGSVLIRSAMGGEVEPGVRRHAGEDGVYCRARPGQVLCAGEGPHQVFRLLTCTRQRPVSGGFGHGHD